MGLDFHPVRSNIPEKFVIECRIEGTGAAAPTKKYGPGVTVTRTSEGLYRFSFLDVPGYFLGMTYGFGAATPTNIDDHSAVHDDLVAVSGSTQAYVEVTVSDGTPAVDDLEDEEYLTVQFHFARTSLYAMGDS